MAANGALTILAAGAAAGKLMLPVCRVCGAVQYPPRSFCRKCLSPEIEVREVDNQGTLIASTRLHRSSDARFKPMLPLRMGSVRLDAGVTVIAFVSDDLLPDAQRVQVTAQLDPLEPR